MSGNQLKIYGLLPGEFDTIILMRDDKRRKQHGLNPKSNDRLLHFNVW